MPDPRDIPLQYQQPPEQHHLKKTRYQHIDKISDASRCGQVK